MLKTVRTYVSDNVEGLAATSAYNAFRNTVRHALFGSALTQAEISSFNAAYGTLGQQTGPVLQQFVTSLMQVQAKLAALSNLNDPYVVKARLGKNQEELQATIQAIQERIDQFSRGAQTGKIVPQTGALPGDIPEDGLAKAQKAVDAGASPEEISRLSGDRVRVVNGQAVPAPSRSLQDIFGGQ
jgi:hypothetical protein